MIALSVAIFIFSTIASVVTISKTYRFAISTLSILVVWLYLSLGPIVVLLSEVDSNSLAYQLFVLINTLFFLPFLYIVYSKLGFIYKVCAQVNIRPAISSGKVIILCACIALSLIVSLDVVLNYGLLFRRLGHEALMSAQANVPIFKLAIYRLFVEASFFVSASLIYMIKAFRVGRVARWLLRFTYFIHLICYGGYFLVNSRMQFVILIVMNLIVVYKNRKFPLLRYSIAILAVVIGMTLLREFILEDTGRLVAGDALGVFHKTLLMVANRVNVLQVFIGMDNESYHAIMGFPGALLRGVYFHLSFFIDPEFYKTVKESLITSNSVYVYNLIEGKNEVDFVKTIVVESIFIGGIFTLPVVAGLFGFLVTKTCKMFYTDKSVFSPFVSLYLLPFVLEFEKELTSIVIGTVKWSAVLFLFWFIVIGFRFKPVDKNLLNKKHLNFS